MTGVWNTGDGARTSVTSAASSTAWCRHVSQDRRCGDKQRQPKNQQNNNNNRYSQLQSTGTVPTYTVVADTFDKRNRQTSNKYWHNDTVQIKSTILRNHSFFVCCFVFFFCFYVCFLFCLFFIVAKHISVERLFRNIHPL